MADPISARTARHDILPLVRQSVAEPAVLGVVADLLTDTGLGDPYLVRTHPNMVGRVAALEFGDWRARALRRRLRGRVRVAGHERSRARVARDEHPLLDSGEYWWLSLHPCERLGFTDLWSGDHRAVLLGEQYAEACRPAHCVRLVWWGLAGMSVPAEVWAHVAGVEALMALDIEMGGF